MFKHWKKLHSTFDQNCPVTEFKINDFLFRYLVLGEKPQIIQSPFLNRQTPRTMYKMSLNAIFRGNPCNEKKIHVCNIEWLQWSSMGKENQTRSHFTFSCIIFPRLNFDGCHESFKSRMTNEPYNEQKQIDL